MEVRQRLGGQPDIREGVHLQHHHTCNHNSDMAECDCIGPAANASVQRTHPSHPSTSPQSLVHMNLPKTCTLLLSGSTYPSPHSRSTYPEHVFDDACLVLHGCPVAVVCVGHVVQHQHVQPTHERRTLIQHAGGKDCTGDRQPPRGIESISCTVYGIESAVYIAKICIAYLMNGFVCIAYMMNPCIDVPYESMY